MNPQSLGQLMISVEGVSLDAPTKERLLHPDVGGVILFSRNHAEMDQLRQLVYEIKNLRNEPLLVSVDQEGGLVQRFKKGFTLLPPMASIGEIYEVDPDRACQHAEDVVAVDHRLAPLSVGCRFVSCHQENHAGRQHLLCSQSITLLFRFNKTTDQVLARVLLLFCDNFPEVVG